LNGTSELGARRSFGRSDEECQLRMVVEVQRMLTMLRMEITRQPTM
jgi:hypothetical protein